MPTVATYNNNLSFIVNNSKVSHNDICFVHSYSYTSYHKCGIVLAQEIEACVIYFCMKTLKPVNLLWEKLPGNWILKTTSQLSYFSQL